MQSIQEALKKVNIVSTNDKTIVAAPAVAPQIVETPTPPVIIDVKPPEASSTPEGTPPVTSDGIPAVSPDAHASVIEDEQSEIQESEVPEGLRKRFSKLTTKNKLAVKEAEDARQQAETLKLEIEAEKREKAFYQEMLLAQANNPAAPARVEKPVVAPAPPVDRPPTLDDFRESENQLEDYINAKVEYGLNKGMQRIVAQTDPAVVEKRRQEEAFKRQYPDFASVMHDKNPAIKVLVDNPVTDQIIGRTKDNLALLYHYAKNPAAAQKLAAMTDPVDVAMELADLKSQLKNNTVVVINEPMVTASPTPNRVNPNEEPKVPNNGQLPTAPVHEPIKLHVTKAPEPYTPINSQASQTYPAVESLSPDEMLNDPRYARLFQKKR